MAGGLSAALAGLSAVPGGFGAGQMQDLQIEDERRKALAKTALGNALSLMAGGQGGGLAPGGPQPQPPMPGAPSPQGAPQQPGITAGGPPQAMGRGAMPSTPQPAGGPPQGMPQQGMPQGGPQLPGGRQALDWRQIVATIRQSNPNIPPAVMAEAVNQFLPMMTQQSQMEWRNVSLQLREQALQQREQQFMLAESGRNQRADQASADRQAGIESRERTAAAGRVSRETIAKMTVDERREAHEAGLISKEQMDEANRESRERLAGRRLDQQQQQFEERETRLGAALELRADTTYQRLEQQKQQALDRVRQAQGKQGLAEARALIDAQDKHVRQRIQAYNQANTMKPSDRKAMLDQADMDYNEQIAQLKQAAQSGGGAAPTNASGGAAPPTALQKDAQGRVKVQTPEEADKLAPGTKYVTPDGQEFTR